MSDKSGPIQPTLVTLEDVNVKPAKRKREIDEKDESNDAKKNRSEETARQLIAKAENYAKQHAASNKENDSVVLQWIRAANLILVLPYGSSPDILLPVIDEAKKAVAELKITKDTQFNECRNLCTSIRSYLSGSKTKCLDDSIRYESLMFFCNKELEMYDTVPSRVANDFLGVYYTMRRFVEGDNGKSVNDEIIRDVIKNIYESFKKLKLLMSAKEEKEVWEIVGKLKSLIKNPNENDVRMHVAFNKERSNLEGYDIDYMINLIEAMNNKQSCDYRNLAWVNHLSYTRWHDIYSLQQAITALNSIPKQEQTAEDKLNLQQYEKEMPSTSSTFFSTSASAGSSMSAAASSAAASSSVSAAASVSSAANEAPPVDVPKSEVRHR